jgi:hypothetical protein
MAAKVFLCYRRDDSAGYAGRVQDRLAQEFGRDLLFMDVDAIPLGVNFATVLRNEVAKCEVLLAVIGPHWLDARDEAGTRRLDDPQDFVRIEIGAALHRNIPVIPILLDGAKVPKANQLPKDLEELSMRNGLDIRHASFHNDIDRLVRSLKGQLSEADAEKRRHEEEERRRQEAEVKQREGEEELRRKAEAEEHRRQEAQDRRRLAEAEYQKRLDEARRSKEEVIPAWLEEEGKRANERIRAAVLEEERQRKLGELKPWLLPLIGAAAAALPTLVFWLYISFGTTTKTQYNPSDVFFIAIPALYGGAAGMLLRHFGILKAVAIPVIPAFLLFVTFSIFAVQHGDRDNNVGTALFLLVPPVICAWLAFWLHSRWVRKLIDSRLGPP